MRDQSLAGARRTDQQHTARDTSTQALEFSGITQELDDLLQVLFRFIDTGDVVKGDATVRFSEQLRARLAETEGLASGTLHLA